MFKALNRSGQLKIASEIEKGQSDFSCPECKSGVIFKKCRKKQSHFAHKPPFNCYYGEGESAQHHQVKWEIYSALKDHPRCSKCELERPLEGVRPDVSLYVGNLPVVI